MEGVQYLYYALGELCYCVAKADGKIQREEKEALHQMVLREADNHNLNADISEIIFRVLDDSHETPEKSYHSAIDVIRKHNSLFNQQLMDTFLGVLQTVADAYPPFSIEEELFIERVKEDFKQLVRA